MLLLRLRLTLANLYIVVIPFNVYISDIVGVIALSIVIITYMSARYSGPIPLFISTTICLCMPITTEERYLPRGRHKFRNLFDIVYTSINVSS